MDLTALSQSVITALTAVASVTLSISPAVPPSEVKLTDPEIISSYNLPQETSSPHNLNILSGADEGLKLVVKEAKANEVVTVDQPEFTVKQPELDFTVEQPAPKPSSSPKSSDKPHSDYSEKTASEQSDTPKPSASPSVSPSSTPSPVPSESTKNETNLTSPNAQILFDMTNSHRAKIGKPALEKEERLCKIAENRAPQVNSELKNGTLHKGFRELNLPYWATENIAAYSTMEQNFNFLVTDYIHRKAIESDAKYSCTACVGTSCSQIFSSFLPK